jgi:hypothetical protein
VTALPDPERAWERAEPIASFDPADVERRLGATDEPLELLGGGHANSNIRVGQRRVLRIYRRDRAALARERALLRQPWTTFVVPDVLDAGDDFLVLSYVPHDRLTVSGDHGAATGRALAEIHRRRFSRAGFLDGDLHVVRPFDDVVDALVAYAREELGRAAADADAARPGDRVMAFLAARVDALRDAAGPAVLLHGDFKASNLHRTGANRLLVLDWEFAYAGPALMDVGQLLRWDPPPAFVSAFEAGYRAGGGHLPEGWRHWSDVFDLFNLAGLLGGAAPGSRRALDVRARMMRTLAASVR